MKSMRRTLPTQRLVPTLRIPRVLFSRFSTQADQRALFVYQHAIPLRRSRQNALLQRRASFHKSAISLAQPPTADALMENLNDLYATAKDEFEIAMEETEANTVYAADDRLAAIEALKTLKEAFEQAVRESDPETGKEVQGRVGQRIRELEGAIENMEKMATEGD